MNIDQNIKAIEKANTKVVGFLENSFVKYGFLIFIVIRIIFIDRMESWYLELFNNTFVKIIYALLVAYSACFECFAYFVNSSLIDYVYSFAVLADD